MHTGQTSLLAARGLTDDADRLLTADEPLADLHARCGGTLPGTLAIPELLALVKQGRELGLKIAREFAAFDGEEIVRGFVRVSPLEEHMGGGCEVLIEQWHTYPQPEEDSVSTASLLDDVDRASAEITARLDQSQRAQVWNFAAADGDELRQIVQSDPGAIWSKYVELQGVAHQQPMHWRLLDGAQCRVPGSSRKWKARLLPLGTEQQLPRGFELLLVPEEPLGQSSHGSDGLGEDAMRSGLVGSTLTPVLRQPIARVIANAETMRARLAGPLRAEYSDYAGNIASAGKHLAGMLDDLTDLEAVEAPGFSTISEAVDLNDVARRAAGILGVRAQARSITLRVPDTEQASVVANGEFRRILQIAINLIGNAIAYSPEGSTVSVSVEGEEAGKAVLSVCDEGPGVSEDQAKRIFDKFERLGRDNDGGSGLGLYISRRLALAMGGDLMVANAGGEGAEFRLELPHHAK